MHDALAVHVAQPIHNLRNAHARTRTRTCAAHDFAQASRYVLQLLLLLLS
jgi:hypothetical protein